PGLGGWSPDGERFCSFDTYLIKVWDRRTLHEVHTLRAPADLAFASVPQWSPDGRRLTTVAWNHKKTFSYSWDASPGYEAARPLSLPDTPPEEVEARALTQLELGNTLREAARPKDAEAAYRRALDLLQDLVRGHPRQPTYRQSLARTHFNMGVLFR